MNVEQFPITDYYKGKILDGVTLSKSGAWWTAILLIEDPRSQLPFINLYRWQHTEAGWKVRGRFKISTKEDATNIVDVLSEFLERLF
jgi:hypothetical protein